MDQLHILSQATLHSSLYRFAGDMIYPLLQLVAILGIVGLFLSWRSSSGRKIQSLQMIGVGLLVGEEIMMIIIISYLNIIIQK